jgi:capsular polysaccharide biosynthesis protein
MAQDNEKVTGREDEEIELMDYLIVLWKHKWLIMVGTFICVVTAGIVAFNMTKIYEVSTSINVGRIEGRFVEEGSIISERVKSISLRKEIAQKLSLAFKEISGKGFFEVSPKGNKDTLTVEIKRETAKPDQAIKILEIVNENIIQGHQSKIEKARKTLLDKIVINESKIAVTETQIEALKKELSDKIAINEKWIEIKQGKQKALEKQLADIERGIRTLEEVRDSIIKRKLKEVDVVGMVAYFNDLQARLNSAYSTRSQIIDQIPSEIQSYRANIAALQARLTNLNGLPFEIESYKEDVATLQAKLNEIRETEIIDPPHSSYYPVKPQKKRILAIAAVLGFIVCIFLAFFFEYTERYRERKVKTE